MTAEERARRLRQAIQDAMEGPDAPMVRPLSKWREVEPIIAFVIRAAESDEREACVNKARRLAEGLESAAEHKDGWEAAMLSTAASTLRSLEAAIRLRREEREGA